MAAWSHLPVTKLSVFSTGYFFPWNVYFFLLFYVLRLAKCDIWMAGGACRKYIFYIYRGGKKKRFYSVTVKCCFHAILFSSFLLRRWWRHWVKIGYSDSQPFLCAGFVLSLRLSLTLGWKGWAAVAAAVGAARITKVKDYLHTVFLTRKREVL